MSKSTRWALVFAVLAACASGGQSGGDDQGYLDAATTPPQDASTTPPTDAPAAKLDGGVTPPPADAAVTPPPVDAAPSLFCTTNSQCTVSGECCVTLGGPQGFCAPGTVVLGQCVPQ